ncbi:MAG: excinuclease ABC subunit UvrC [Clostridiales bacterium]|nr:excinuclease ABC subunit UvrC [Clostridiales bacterium]
MVDFKAKLKDVPTNPGVYMMLDSAGEIIYVGKAKNLKNRLKSYFFNLSNRTAKVMAMLEHVDDFRYIICASEVDALVTENNLIKKHTPRYNILLKDDKAYPFLRVDMKQAFPKIEVVRRLKNDGAKYFGPYMQSVNVRDITDLIHTAFSVRDCNRDMSKPTRPCLNKHLGRCLAPCSGEISSEEYKAEIQKVIDFLKGNDREVERVLNEKMRKFADEENFEVALNYRNKLQVLDKIVRKQVSALPKDFNLDIFAFESNGIISAINMLVVRGGKLVGGENFTVSAADEDLASYIYQYYVNNAPLCDEVVTDGVEDVLSLEEAICKLCPHTVRVVEPKQGVRKQLLELAHSNAYDAMVKHGTQDERKELRTTGAVRQLAELLGLKTLPNRIEGYDISHISGTDKVASMVVFEGGQPKKAHYRKFKIKTVEGNNDFACMKEVLTRRLNKLHDEDESFGSIPDLLLIDGGKGQLAYAKEAQAVTGREDIEIISLAKREEEVFLGSDPTEPVILPKDSVALQLLQRVRDESHRFAITFHRSLRSKHLSESALKNIKGVGEKTASALIRRFGSVEQIKHKTAAELAELDGISIAKAEYILEQLGAAKAEDSGQMDVDTPVKIDGDEE